MADDINQVGLVGRLTRDAELTYTNSGSALCKLSVAVNRRKKKGDEWVDEANFFDVTIWGKRGEALNQYLTKGTQVGIQGQLKQERWEKEGTKRSKVSIDASNIQLLGSGGGEKQSKPQQSKSNQQSFESYTPPSRPIKDDYDDDVPF